MRISTLDFSQARIAPESVMRGLELLDPTACIVHMGGEDWLVGKMRPNRLAMLEAAEMIENWTRAIRVAIGLGLHREAKSLLVQAVPRVRFGQLALLGVRVVATYKVRSEMDFARILADFKESRFRWLHAREDEPLTWQDKATEQQQAAALKDLSDIGRARDAHRYAFTRSHMPSVSLTPTVGPKSGFVRHAISPT